MKQAKRDIAKPPSDTKHKSSLWRPIALAVVLVLLMILTRVFNLGDRLGDLREWIHSLGIFGPLVYVMIYAAAFTS